MDHGHQTLTLYTAQSEAVLAALRRDGVCHSKAEYVERKYAGSAPVFLTAYRWFVSEAERLVPRPAGAEFPYWAFRDLYSLDTAGGNVLTLRVPAEEAVLFDLYDWNRILCMKYLGESEAEEQAFHRELSRRGLRETDVMLTDFHPELKRQILDSWRRLLRHHRALLAGDRTGVGGVQAGLWRLRSEWVSWENA